MNGPHGDRVAEELARAAYQAEWVKHVNHGVRAQITARWVWAKDQLDSEGFWGVLSWPDWAVANLLRFRRSNDDRYKLHRFLTFNGANPEIRRKITLMGAEDLLKAERHVGQMEAQVERDDARYWGGGRVYSMIERGPMPVPI